MTKRNIFLLFLLVIMFVNTLFAGSKTREQWLYGLPVDNKLYLGIDNYIADDTTNHEIDVSTNVNITGKIDVSGVITGNGSGITGVTGATDNTCRISTGTLRNEIITSTAALVTATALVQTNLNTETTNRTSADLVIGLTTASIDSNSISRDTAIGVDTGTVAGNLATETINRTSGDSALGLSTATLQTNITNGDSAIASSTGTLDTNKLNKSGGTMTGSILSTGEYEVSYATITIGQVMRIINQTADPSDIYLTTGTVWMKAYEVYMSTGWDGTTPIKVKFDLVPVP